MKNVVLLSIASAAVCFSYPATAYFDSGNTLQSLCSDKDRTTELVCTGVAGAYFDMMVALGYSGCRNSATRKQLKDVLLKYIDQNPEKRDLPSSFLAIEAFSKALGCSKATKQSQ
ncbi:Rap1a/Tai family immunity protein [Bradyrhizobium sp. BR 1432]|uniref:Rap1a/Tai family immunity protein n=1 Tax=Bradyrhizobium sp. BR 1432 TaxID=3447966 RepID=UPI003EE6D71B